MGVFINIGMQPDVFMNKEEIMETNQSYFKTDYVAEMINEQKKINNSLLHSYHLLTSLYENQENSRASQWKQIDSQLRELKRSNLQRNQFEDMAMERFSLLSKNDIEIHETLKDESLLRQKVMDQINNMGELNQDIVNQLNAYKLSTKELVGQMADQVSSQEVYQNQLFSRLENQEALMEKMLREINHFRAVIFERTNHLTEKIQDGFNLTSSYMYNFFTNSDQPLTLFMKNRKEDNTKNKPNKIN